MNAATATRHQFMGLGPHGFHRVGYDLWGDARRDRVLICVHGLTGNRHDFDYLAPALADARRVACPDVAGRGESDWLPHKEDYNYPQYLADMNALIARLDVESVDWVGTSMGGLIGMLLAAQPRSPIRRLVVNDIGPLIPAAALERIAAYLGQDISWASHGDLEQYLRLVHAPFGPLTDEQWSHLCHHRGVPKDGRLRLHYDPGIAEPMRQGPIEDVDLRHVWKAVRCPVLLLRGADSDVLTWETAQEMVTTHPGTTLEEFEGIGHAPALMDADQIGVVRDWLLRS